MSTRHLADGMADRSLFSRLVDDAAVFPPGNAPIDRALTEHALRRGGPYGDLVGPLLIEASGAAALRRAAGVLDDDRLLDAAAGHPPYPPVTVGLIARPGTPVDDLATAVDTLRGSDHLQVGSVELAADPGWAAALRWELPLAVEVPRDPVAQRETMEALAGAREVAVGLAAKLRTQSTRHHPVPSAAELATFVLACEQHGLPFKLTGGLHRAVRHTVDLPDGSHEDRHGVLNVLLATHRAAQGGHHSDVVETLLIDDGPHLADEVRRLSADEARAARARFASLGCCDVLDPIGDLVELGVLPAHRHTHHVPQGEVG